MARLPRYFAEGLPLHIIQRGNNRVIQRGNNREPIFGAEPDYRFYLDCLRRAASEHAVAIHAYAFATLPKEGRPVKND